MRAVLKRNFGDVRAVLRRNFWRCEGCTEAEFFILMLGGRYESVQCDVTLGQELGFCSLSEKHGKPRCRSELRSIG